MLELLVRAYIEDRHREIDGCSRAAEAKRWARLSEPPRSGWFGRPRGLGQRSKRASSAVFAAGHSASTSE